MTERERISLEEYRALTTTKPAGSKRGTQGSSVGTCRVCHQHVRTTDPAWFHADIHPDRETRWVEHQACHKRPV